MVETYSSSPFISYDGPDDTGLRAEVKVVTGLGKIEKIEPSSAGKSMKVSFSVENTKFLSAGWAPADSNVMKVVENAKESEELLHFRIETRRQDRVDRKTPINELSKLASAKDNIHKSLAAVKTTDSDEWIISPFAKTRMEEDPRTGVGGSAYDYSLEELEKLNPQKAEESKKTTYSGSGVEGTPFQTYNRDGRLNPGSTAVAVPLNIYSFLTEYFKESGETQLDERTKLIAVEAVLKVCNQAQLIIYEGLLEKPDLNAGSHTRARALVFESIKSFYPLTGEIIKDKDALKEWSENTLTKIVRMWRWSINKVDHLLK